LLSLIGVTLLGGLTGGLISSLARVFVTAVELAKSPYSSHSGTENSLDALVWAYPELCFMLAIGALVVTTSVFYAFLGILPNRK
jgi:hypothetical protein